MEIEEELVDYFGDLTDKQMIWSSPAGGGSRPPTSVRPPHVLDAGIVRCDGPLEFSSSKARYPVIGADTLVWDHQITSLGQLFEPEPFILGDLDFSLMGALSYLLPLVSEAPILAFNVSLVSNEEGLLPSVSSSDITRVMSSGSFGDFREVSSSRGGFYPRVSLEIVPVHPTRTLTMQIDSFPNEGKSLHFDPTLFISSPLVSA
jgi:hypothetical protein